MVAEKPLRGLIRVGGGPLSVSEGGYETVAPSPLPVNQGWPVPRPIAYSEIPKIVEMFRSAAARAQNAGADVLELHGAHGYLIHQFLSPITNRRDDAYGGSLANRMRFCLEVFEAVRAVWPHDKPLGIRVSATDWAEGGWTLEDTIALARRLELAGLRLHGRVQRRLDLSSKNRNRSRVSDSLRGRDQGSGHDAHHHCRRNLQPATGRDDPAYWPGGHGRVSAPHAL